jgi:hypothetical protein
MEMRPEHQPREASGADRIGGMIDLPREGDHRPNFGEVAQSRRGGLNDQLDLSITEIAVMWILHHGNLPHRPLRSLTRDIVDFYPAALDTILRAEALRGARPSDLRLIYFKGLIVALTHPKLQMIDAIRHADRVLDRGTRLAGPSDASARRLAASQPSEDQDTLAHIADALGSPPGSSH